MPDNLKIPNLNYLEFRLSLFYRLCHSFREISLPIMCSTSLRSILSWATEYSGLLGRVRVCVPYRI
jgi:hypothetical protein